MKIIQVMVFLSPVQRQLDFLEGLEDISPSLNT